MSPQSNATDSVTKGRKSSEAASGRGRTGPEANPDVEASSLKIDSATKYRESAGTPVLQVEPPPSSQAPGRIEVLLKLFREVASSSEPRPGANQLQRLDMQAVHAALRRSFVQDAVYRGGAGQLETLTALIVRRQHALLRPSTGDHRLRIGGPVKQYHCCNMI